MDKIGHGTHLFGERIHNAKLKEAEVREIRGIAASKTYAEISVMFGVSESTISSIVHRKRWRHVA